MLEPSPFIIEIPAIGLGTFQPEPGKYPTKSVKQSVLWALEAGYRHFDTSLRYGDGQGEMEVGEAIKESHVPRDEIFVVTKLENVYHAPEDVEVNLNISLKNLGLTYVDLFIMHFPYAYKKTANYGTERDARGRPVIDIELSRSFDVTWRAMEKLVEAKKTKYIGLSNFSSPKIKRLLRTAKIKPVVNQIECHPHWPQKGLVKLCQDNGIHVTAFGPLGGMPIPSLVGRTGPGPLEGETIALVAHKYSKTPAQVILCHLLCRGISVIPKSNSRERLKQNYDCIFDMEESDFTLIDNLMGEDGKRGVRNFNSLEYLGFDNYNEDNEEP
ncbi:NADP-dependent oxidoreductase domain-containing protein [Hypoxylon argillaceum]|nr:NADP-dependent oxidoreductase domain-containing protein [Hypoxylon argillaceum]